MPATKTRPPVALEVEFVPSDVPGPLRGLVQLTRGRSTGLYAVGELACDRPGRWFTLAKVEGGSDGEASGYTVGLTYGGAAGQCECRGHLRHGHCRHVEGLGRLLSEGVL